MKSTGRSWDAFARVPIALAALSACLHAPAAAAHGGLSMDADFCKLRIGRHVMHFTGYLPESAQATKEFCEDIPATGRAVIVLDYLDNALRDLPVEVRIIRAGAPETNIDAITVAHLPAKRYPSGSISLEHSFDAPGKFVGLVTVRDTQELVSRFPFSVGASASPWRWVAGIALGMIAAVALYLVGHHQRARLRTASRPAD